MEKYDIKKAHKGLYAPSSKDFALVDVPEFRYIAVDGHGDPNTSTKYAAAIEALYGVAYVLKFESKNALGRDFVVGPLEGLWGSDDVSSFVRRDKDAWNWTMMIAQPDWISSDMVTAAIEKASAKKENAALGDLRILTLTEGASLQILHIGSYDDETPTLSRLHSEYMPGHDFTFNGLHHEIYLSDARRTAPEKLRTILRQPVKPS
ncbi:GyrI-like domain-containing protein [Saxibacter everestensis]|uniref:GyrI-like domain-containing protein n=2 Tax=Saxibacter everestensis TaxID=2909229 RepID=A0ABY8QYN0_9MICO|nr:GyrI-like domain-containing protein [Brevibacteriaceae bacterium ZFBP1038]